MRIAVTGASGFVGGAVARAAVAAGWSVVAFGRRPAVAAGHVAGAPYRAWDLAAGPLADPPEVDAVVHAGAFVGETGRLSRALAANVAGTAAVLDTFPGARVVHVSSASVYHPHRPQVLAGEDEAPDPDAVRWPGPYGRTKALAERLVAARRPDAVVLRPHAVYGPGDTTLLPRVLAAVRGGVLPLPGDGTQVHALTRIDTVAQACLRACDRAVPGGAYNVTDAEPVALADALAEALAARGLRVRVVPVGRRPALMAGAALDAVRRAGVPVRVPLSAYSAGHLSLDRTFDLRKARDGLGLRPPVTHLGDAADW